MRRKMISVLTMAVLSACLLCGCGSDETVAVSSDGELSTADEETEVVEEKLNIIDDNYRNYYEIFVYSFYDSDGDGIGDLNGVTEKLDYIADMGFNGIWLMPIMPSPSYHKYDVTDYFDIDPAYGTMEDFENLLSECHARGIRLVIDMDFNHTSSQHPWFKEACEYLASLQDVEDPEVLDYYCPYVDYYHFSREQETGYYYQVPGTSGDNVWYYEGYFSTNMPDLAFENDDVVGELLDIIDFWVGKGVDGFRMDAAMHYSETDAALNETVLNRLYTHALESNPDFYMVSEVWADSSTIENYYEVSQTPSFFNFPDSSAEGVIVQTAMGTAKAEKFVNSLLSDQQTYTAAYADYIDAPFLTNHDQVRVANNLQNNEDNLKMAAGLLMTMNGSPFVYYGEEIGMMSKGQEDENKRIPMVWSDSDDTGITQGPPNMTAGITSAFPGVEEQLEDETSLLNYYKAALRMRNENPEIARGEISIVDGLTEGTTAVITKTWEGSTIAIAYNTDSEATTIELSGSEVEGMELAYSLTIGSEGVSLDGGTLSMPGKSICVLR